MKKLILHRTLSLVTAIALAVPANAQRKLNLPSDEKIIAGLPAGVSFEPNIAYRDGNAAWRLDLAMPTDRGETPRPAIVFIHGGGWRNGDKRAGSFLRPTIEYAAKGYVCVTVNYRMLDQGPINICVEDVKNAVRWLRANAEKYNVDPDRIGASGNSAGAHLSVMLGVSSKEISLEGDGPYREFSSAVQAVVASATPTDFIGPMSSRQRTAPARPQPNSIRSIPEASKRLVSPMSYISPDVPPILLFHEASDRTVGVYHSDKFTAALTEVGAKDINYVRLGDGSGHGVFQKNILITESMREAFFKRILKTGN